LFIKISNKKEKVMIMMKIQRGPFWKSITSALKQLKTLETFGKNNQSKRTTTILAKISKF